MVNHKILYDYQNCNTFLKFLMSYFQQSILLFYYNFSQLLYLSKRSKDILFFHLPFNLKYDNKMKLEIIYCSLNPAIRTRTEVEDMLRVIQLNVDKKRLNNSQIKKIFC